MAHGKVLLLDVMDTLVVDPFRSAIPAFFGLSLEQLLEQKHPTAWLEFERGELSEKEYAAKMFADRRHFDHVRLRAHIARAYRFIDGVETLLAELCDHEVEMHALSNYPEWYRLVEERLRLSRYVRWSFVSCRTGVRKPDRQAYLGAAEALGREPAECLFVDDRPKNVRAAEAVGMPTIVFESATALRRALVERGVLPGGAALPGSELRR